MLLKKMIKADARGQLTTIYDWIRDPREIDKQVLCCCGVPSPALSSNEMPRPGQLALR